MKVYKFLLNTIFFIYRKIITLYSFWSIFNNIIKGLPWRLAYYDWKISILNNPDFQDLRLKHLLQRYFLIANNSFSKYGGRYLFLENYKNKKELNRQLSNANKLPPIESITFLKNLSNYFQYFKNFQEYVLIRKCYRKKLIELQVSSKTLNPDALRSCLELDKLDLAEKLILTKKINMFNKKQILEIDNYICLIKKINSKKFRKKNNNKDYRKYLNVIHKSPIIVKGPTAKKNFSFKQRGEIIVQINEIKKQYKNNVISYYNGGSIERYSGDIIKTLPTLLFSCFKTKGSFYPLIFKVWRKNYKTRVYHNLKNILLNKYGAFTIQNIIFDLLIHRPKKIFLTGMTFYLGKKLYEKDYIGPNVSMAHTVQALRIHEPFSNFLFIKNLYKRGVILVDGKLAKILKLSETKYAIKLDQKYGEISYQKPNMQ
jgi:hypothetical protein